MPAPATQPPDQPPRQIGAAPADPSDPPALTAWMVSVLEPLMVELRLSREQLVTQATTIGRLEAENEALRASQAPVASNLTAEAPAPLTELSPTPDPFPVPLPPTPNATPWWRRWLAAAYGW